MFAKKLVSTCLIFSYLAPLISFATPPELYSMDIPSKLYAADWGNAISYIGWDGDPESLTKCEYKFDNEAYTEIPCTIGYPDEWVTFIPTPSVGVSHTLTLRATNATAEMGTTTTNPFTLVPDGTPLIFVYNPGNNQDLDPDGWFPYIEWVDNGVDGDVLTLCEYSYDDATYHPVGCGNSGSDLPYPEMSGAQTLYLRATDSLENVTTEQISFNFTAPISTGPNSAFCATVSDVPAAECEALLDIYDSNGGTSWTYTAGWGTSEFVCGWFGVTCTNSNVTGLDLTYQGDGNGLTGTFSISHGSLNFLTSLNLSSGALTSFTSSTLGSLTNLNLQNNQLTSFSITGSPSLQSLYLAYNKLTSFNFAGLSSLTTASLSNNLITSLQNTDVLVNIAEPIFHDGQYPWTEYFAYLNANCLREPDVAGALLTWIQTYSPYQWDVPNPNGLCPEIPPSPVTVTCSPSTTEAVTGEPVTWIATPSGGNGTFTYSWSGSDSLSGIDNPLDKVYDSTGVKTATVTASSGGLSSDPTDCTASVTVSPGELDQIPPVITAFTVPSTSTSLTTNISTFTATDNLNAIAGYLVTESAIPPSVGNPGWSVTPQTSYVFGTQGSKTLYAWVKDTDWNISSSASQTVMVDSVAPSVSAFLVPAISTSRTIPITTFTASDTIGVTGYFINEEFLAPNVANPGWSATPQTSYTVSADGYTILVSWAKDALGHISSPIDRTVLVDTIPPTVTAFSVPTTSASRRVDITTFTATDNIPADHGNTPISGYLVTETAISPSAGNPGWSATPQTSYTFSSDGSKTLYAWTKDSVGHISTSLSQEVIVDTSWTRVNNSHTVFCETVSMGLVSECEALMNIYDNNGGTNWTNKTGWGVATNICTWSGVGCTGDRIMTLDLSDNNLIHPFAITQGALPDLTHLYLQNNHITSFDDTGFDSLTNLNLLHNDLTSFSGTSLEVLTYLNISSNQLASFAKTGMDSLRELYLGSNLLESFDTAGLSTVQEIDLSDNLLTSFNGSGLTSLTNIWLNYNHISSLQNIPNIPAVDANLYSNCLSRSNMDPDLVSWLDDFDADFETRSDFCPLTFCETTDIYPDECEALLDIYENSGGENWTDKTGWGTMTNVCDYGHYDGHSWYGVQCETSYVSQKNHVAGLNLSNNGLTGAFSFSQGNLNSLTSLDLSENQLTSFENIGLSSLTHLILNGNLLTSFDASGLNDITTLYINNNHITTLGNTDTLTNLMSMYAMDNCLDRSSLGDPISNWMDSHADENWETRNAFCPIPPVTVTCIPSVESSLTGQSVTWNALASGGDGTYTYQWIGDGSFSAIGQNPSKIYTTPGLKTARVVATSGGVSSASTDCTSGINIIKSGGGNSPILLFGCTDPRAVNYTKNVLSRSSMCQYLPGIIPTKPTVTVIKPTTIDTIPKLDSASSGDPEKSLCSTRTYPTKYIRLGQKNDPEQVKLLEQYLNMFEGESLIIDGIYSQEDANAVIRWQEKYALDILTPWGEIQGTGYVFITSLRKFREFFEAQCRKDSNQTINITSPFTRNLYLGMKGDDVRALQEILIKKSTGPAAQLLANIGVTGFFGPTTREALIEFQKSHLLNPANGEMGIITQYLLTE